MMQNLGNRRFVQKCAQKAGSNVLEYSFDLGFPRFVYVTYSTLIPMSAGQTTATCGNSAFPRLVSLFRLCTANLKNMMRVNIEKQMKMLYINRLNVEYNVN